MIGQQIRYYRKRNSLTQQQLADKLGVTWEMVSRYERGTSSPIKKIDDIAKALNTEVYKLLKDHDNSDTELLAGLSNRTIPLFTEVPNLEDKTFKPENTTCSYTVPDWMIRKDLKIFAITPSLAKILTVQIKKSGIVYVSPETEPSVLSAVLFWRGDQLTIDQYEKITIDDNVIGVILAQEVRLG